MTHNDPYFTWLCRKVWIEKGKMQYFRLAECLHMTAFTPHGMEMDRNRAMDGMQLRVIFMQNHGPVGSSVNRGPCTMLEMLVELARKMSFIMEDVDNPHRTAECFWRMIRNLGLIQLRDLDFDENDGTYKVAAALKRVNDRTYDRNGLGGLFPLNRPQEDQRQVEIWYQMHAWLIENNMLDLSI